MKLKYLYVVILALGLAICDLALKHYFAVVSNPGIALGLDSVVTPAMLHLGLILLAAAVFIRSRDAKLKLLLVFLATVSISNLIDRVLFGAVRDYLNLWSIWFNLADVAIVAGVIIYIIELGIKEYETYHSRIGGK